MFTLVINFSATTRVISYDLIIYDFKNNFYEPITTIFFHLVVITRKLLTQHTVNIYAERV